MGCPKVTHSFRKKLKDSLPFWQEQGFLSPPQAEAMTAYYRLDGLKSELSRAVVTGVYLIGVFLIGIGVISFIAAHWTAIGRGAKVAMLFAAMLAAHGGGWYLWLGSGRMPRLGQALVVLGTLIFGANIGLMAQIFHVHENPANGYLAWAIGAAAVAYALQSTPNALVAIVVSMIFFFTGISNWPTASLLWFPFAVAAVFIPLAYLCKSRWVIVATLIAIGLAVIFVFIPGEENIECIFILPVFTGVAFTAWGLFEEYSNRVPSFEFPCKIVGFLLCFVFLYLISFWELAIEIQEGYLQFLKADWIAQLVAGMISLAGLGMGVAAIIHRKISLRNKSTLTIQLTAAIAIAVVGLLDAYWLVIIVHLAMLLLAGNLIRLSIQTQSRGLFWAGIWLPGLIILSRTLEYETELLLKAIIFAACGVAVIVAGVMFERQLKKKGAANV